MIRFIIRPLLISVPVLIALTIGLAVGVLGAVRQYSAFDYAATGAAFTMVSMPLFCLAILVKYGGISFNDVLQQIGLGRWLRTAGPPDGGFHGGVVDRFFQYTGAYILPTICLVAIQFAVYSRFQRASMLDTLVPVTTVFTLNLGALVTGAVITETVFGWQGLGRLLVDAVNQQEPYMVLGFLMVTAVLIIVFNLIADIVYAVLDPRIRHD